MMIPLFKSTRPLEKGSVLIGLIVIMLLIFSLGVAMFSFTTTTSYNRIWTNSSAKAYYLAESGFRYADSEYRNTENPDGDDYFKDDRNQILQAWHSPDPPGTPVLFNFDGNMDRFELKAYPYYLVTAASYASGTTSIQAGYSGEKPANFNVPAPPGKLVIGLKEKTKKNLTDSLHTYTAYDSGTTTFTLSTGLASAVSDNTDIYLVTNPSSSALPLSKGDNLTLADASFFPDYNGIFDIVNKPDNDVIYAYRSKSGNTLQDIFNIKDPDGNFDSIDVLTSDDIVLYSFVKLHSIGIVDPGSGMETKREIVYSVPTDPNIIQTEEFHETFEDLSNWEDSAVGGHAIETIGGDKALRVTGTESWGGFPRASLIGLKTNKTLALAWEYGDAYRLSYDAQVKIGFVETATPPDWGYDPAAPIPRYFLAGLAFRLDESLDFYGVSLMRGSNNTAPTPDNLNDSVVPQPAPSPPGKDQRLLIELWQKAGPNDTDSTWLAYKDITPENRTFFADDIESGVNGWAAEGVPAPNGLWHVSARRSYSAGNAWYYGQEATGDYFTGVGAVNSGSLESQPIDLNYATSAVLTFWTWHQTETQDPANYDQKYVEISTNDGASWTELLNDSTSANSNNPNWNEVSIDLASYIGQTIRIRFRFDTVDGNWNTYEGWYIDDVTITGDYEFPLNESTLLVRVLEAASVAFFNGGTTPIKDGDVLVGETKSTVATVKGDPIVSSGSWAGGDAAGLILLESVVGTSPFYTSNEGLRVGGSVLAEVTTTVKFISKANYIRVYYGDPAGRGDPNDDPLDDAKHGNPRNPANVNWPPGEVKDWSADEDYFTLVQWDAVNDAVVTTVDLIPSLDEPNAIIESDELISPNAGLFTRPELGLFTAGKGNLNVFYDDFAFQTEVISRQGFLPPIQSSGAE